MIVNFAMGRWCHRSTGRGGWKWNRATRRWWSHVSSSRQDILTGPLEEGIPTFVHWARILKPRIVHFFQVDRGRAIQKWFLSDTMSGHLGGGGRRNITFGIGGLEALNNGLISPQSPSELSLNESTSCQSTFALDRTIHFVLIDRICVVKRKKKTRISWCTSKILSPYLRDSTALFKREFKWTSSYTEPCSNTHTKPRESWIKDRKSLETLSLRWWCWERRKFSPSTLGHLEKDKFVLVSFSTRLGDRTWQEQTHTPTEPNRRQSVSHSLTL